MAPYQELRNSSSGEPGSDAGTLHPSGGNRKQNTWLTQEIYNSTSQQEGKGRFDAPEPEWSPEQIQLIVDVITQSGNQAAPQPQGGSSIDPRHLRYGVNPGETLRSAPTSDIPVTDGPRPSRPEGSGGSSLYQSLYYASPPDHPRKMGEPSTHQGQGDSRQPDFQQSAFVQGSSTPREQPSRSKEKADGSQKICGYSLEELKNGLTLRADGEQEKWDYDMAANIRKAGGLPNEIAAALKKIIKAHYFDANGRPPPRRGPLYKEYRRHYARIHALSAQFFSSSSETPEATQKRHELFGF